MRRGRQTRSFARAEHLGRALGLGFAVYLVFHVWETSSAIAGREAFLARPAAVVPPLARALVVAVLAYHARLVLRPGRGPAGRYPDAGVRKLQRLAGITVLAFLVVHLGHALVPALVDGPVVAYERLRHDLGQPVFVGVYVAGIAATCLHFAQGIEAASTDVASRFGERAARLSRALGLATAIALFAVATNTLSHFAAGRALVAPDVPH